MPRNEWPWITFATHIVLIIVMRFNLAKGSDYLNFFLFFRKPFSIVQF